MLKKMFHYKVCPHRQTVTETHVGETLPKGSSLRPKGIYTMLSRRVIRSKKEIFCKVPPTTDHLDPEAVQIDLKHFNIKGSLF